MLWTKDGHDVSEAGQIGSREFSCHSLLRIQNDLPLLS